MLTPFTPYPTARNAGLDTSAFRASAFDRAASTADSVKMAGEPGGPESRDPRVDAEAATLAELDARFERRLSKWLSHYRLALGGAALGLLWAVLPRPHWLFGVLLAYMAVAALVLPLLRLSVHNPRWKLRIRICVLLSDVLTVTAFTYAWGVPSPWMFLYMPIAVGWRLLPRPIFGRLAIASVLTAVAALLWLEHMGGTHEPPIPNDSLGALLLLFGVIASCLLAVHKLLSFAVAEAREHAERSSLLLAEQHAKKREAEWARQLEQSARLESLGRLAGGVAHDFNNLLTALIGYAELAEAHLPEGAHAARRALKNIQTAAERGSGLTAQLLEFASTGPTKPRDLDMKLAVQASAQLLQRLLRDNISIRLELSEEPCGVRLDPSSLERLLLNLCVNAADAMPDGGVLTLRVAPDYGGPLERVALEIRDTGIGIPPDDLPHIFEPFFTRKARGKGTGLGLPSVYGIVRQSQGSIEVESTPGKGTTFRIRWPRVPLPKREVLARARPHDARTSKTLVLVDDDEAVRTVCAEHLRQAGYHVIALPSGEAALAVIDERGAELDALVTDVSMPGMSGLELAHAVRARGSRMPVLLISGYADELGQGQGREGLDASFLPKPFSGEALLAEVERMLDEDAGAGVPFRA